MRVVLEVESGPDAGRFITVPHGTEVIVGRKPPAHFVIQGDPTISRAHFALSCIPPDCLVRDLGSTSGTLVNGEPVTKITVKDGDVIEVGTTFLIVRIDAWAPSGKPVRPPMPVEPARDVPAASENPATEEVPIIAAGTLDDRVLGRLRREEDPLFAILDAACDPMVLAHLMIGQERYQSLYEGPQGDRLLAFAPYLVAIPPGSPFLETLVREGWGESWGVYLTSREPFEAVRKHLRRFLMVKIEKGSEVYFRYYDPRVLGVFLPTCNPAEVVEFFGPIKKFLFEGAGPETIREFGIVGQRLEAREWPLGPPVGAMESASAGARAPGAIA
jgi:hypothetical protein